MNNPPVQAGEVLAGKYRVEQVLGLGGMGVVVAATHIQLEERVAIKFLTPEALENPETVARFAREARAAVKIKSEHVARVIDVGTLENGAPYMVMEYLAGGDLSRVLGTQGPFSIEDAVEYILQACEAIAQAHVLGIVHRDLKPANLFLTHRPDGTQSVKVLDFGISKVIAASGSSSDAAMTRTRSVMGSPLYMSPEQMASSRDVDGRTDIWALGAILYELVAGRPPFNGDTLPQLCTVIMNGQPDGLRDIRPGVPAGLDAVIRRCLEKDPTRRFANVGELAMALVEFGPRRARPSAERVARVIHTAKLSESGAVIGPPSGVLGTSTGGSWAETKIPATSSRKTAFVAICALAVLGVVAVVAFMRGERAATSPMGSPPPAAPALAAPAIPAAVPTTIPAPIEPVAPGVASALTLVPAGGASAAQPVIPDKAGTHKGHVAAHPSSPPPAHVSPAPGPPTSKPPAVDLFDDRK